MDNMDKSFTPDPHAFTSGKFDDKFKNFLAEEKKGKTENPGFSEKFDDFLAAEKGEELPSVKKAEAEKRVKRAFFVSGLDTGVPGHRIEHGEKKELREFNFGRIDEKRYSEAFLKALSLADKIHNKKITKDDEVFYTEVVEAAIRASQQYEAGEPAGSPENPQAFMLKVLSNRLLKQYGQTSNIPGVSLKVESFSAIGSDLEKDKGVVGIVEITTPDNEMEKFYLTNRGYGGTNIPPSLITENYLTLGVPAISIPTPNEGFTEDDRKIVLKNALPNRIGDEAAGAMLRHEKAELKAA